jgi:flagellar motor switch/type III secretory pathway protein FliN
MNDCGIVIPFPFDQLPKANRRDAELLRLCARREPALDVQRALSTASELLGIPVSYERGIIECKDVAALSKRNHRSTTFALLDNEAEIPAIPVLLELSPSLAALVVDRALGGDGVQTLAHQLVGLDELSQGILGYIIARVLADLDSPFRLRAVIDKPDPFLVALGDQSLLRIPLQIRMGDEPFYCLVWMALSATHSFGMPVWKPVWNMAPIQLTLVATAGAVQLTAGEWSSVKPTDTVILDRCEISPAPDGWTGRTTLSIDGAVRTRWECALNGRSIRIEAIKTNEDIPVEEARILNQNRDNTEHLLRLAGDAPIELSVEIARFTVTLEELGSLKPGEILLTRRAVGERVTLRAGRSAFASGELVEVEGEIGVRILAPTA